jgi:signal transduction histidine kinase
MCAPLHVNGRTVGAIEVINRDERPFRADDLRLLMSLAASAATAIENARLYQRAQQEIIERTRAEEALEAERTSLARRVEARTEELRTANAELAEAARMKDRFVSNVSHELRTPLSVLTLLSGNLDVLYDRLDDAQRHKMIRDIRDYCCVLNDLIDNVLEISRIDSRRISWERGRVDLGSLVSLEADKQLPLAEKKRHALHVAGESGVYVRGNEGQLRQVIRNLLNNAIKYTPDGGEIICEYRRVEGNGNASDVSSAGTDLPAGAWATLRVSDTGIGISQGDLPRLFERFYRVDAQGSTPGVGLGLSIAKELVELHDGRIAVSSRLGEGTAFTVCLPLLAEEVVDERHTHDSGG